MIHKPAYKRSCPKSYRMWKLYYALNLILYVEQQTSESLMLLCQYGNTLEVLKNVKFWCPLRNENIHPNFFGETFWYVVTVLRQMVFLLNTLVWILPHPVLLHWQEKESTYLSPNYSFQAAWSSQGHLASKAAWNES